MPRAEIAAAADRLAGAIESSRPCAPVRDLIGADDGQAAYAVQQALTMRRIASGGRVVGRKIGLTSLAVQEQLGVAEPDFGVLFHEMTFQDGDVVPSEMVLQPRVEAEVAFVLESDLGDGPLDLTTVRDAVGSAMPAIEICGSRIAEWDISFGDTVADNASAGAYVVGHATTLTSAIDLREIDMVMSVNDVVVSTGSGADCLGSPLRALLWLARVARDLGDPLRAGQTILSGALGPMVPVVPGQTVRATLSRLGSVQFTLGEARG